MRAAQRTRGPQSLGPALKNCASERLLYDNVKNTLLFEIHSSRQFEL